MDAGRVPRALLAEHMVELAQPFCSLNVPSNISTRRLRAGHGGMPHHTLQVLETPAKVTLRAFYGNFLKYTANVAPEKTGPLRIPNSGQTLQKTGRYIKIKI